MTSRVGGSRGSREKDMKRLGVKRGWEENLDRETVRKMKESVVKLKREFRRR